MITLDEMSAALGHRKEIAFKEETVNGFPVVIVSYMVATSDLWDEPFALEARGITFDANTGQIISLPFPKFFNHNERPETQTGAINWDDVVFHEKLDGSMITPVMLPDGTVCLKTKKSFHNEVAVEAIRNAPSDLLLFCAHLLKMNLCPIFEYMSRQYKVVIDYGVASAFKLLAVRDMSSGEFIDPERLQPHLWDIEVAQRQFVDFKTISEMEGIEGFVGYIDGVPRVKLKTKWYLDRHRVIDVRTRDVARLVFEDVIDDHMEVLQQGVYDPENLAHIIEDANGALMMNYRLAVELANLVGNTPGLTPKDQYDMVCERVEALSHDHRDAPGWLPKQSLVKLCLSHLRNPDEDRLMQNVRRQCIQHVLPTFDLMSIGNPNFGVK